MIYHKVQNYTYYGTLSVHYKSAKFATQIYHIPLCFIDSMQQFDEFDLVVACNMFSLSHAHFVLAILYSETLVNK